MSPNINNNEVAKELSKNNERLAAIMHAQDLDWKFGLALAGSPQNDALEEIQKDPFLHDAVLAFAERNADGSIKWVPDRFQQLNQALVAAQEYYTQQIESLKTKSTRDVHAYAKGITEALEDMQEAKKDYAKATVNANAKQGELLPLNETIVKLKPDAEILAARQSILVDVGQIITSFQPENPTVKDVFDSLKTALSEMKTKAKKLEIATEMEKAVQPILDDIKAMGLGNIFTADRYETIKKKIVDLSQLLSATAADDQKKLEEARTDIEQKIADTDTEKRQHILRRFDAREKYFEKLGGTDYPDYVTDALTIDFRFEPTLLTQRLAALGKMPQNEVGDAGRIAKIVSEAHLDDVDSFAHNVGDRINSIPNYIQDVFGTNILKDLAFTLLTKGENSYRSSAAFSDWDSNNPEKSTEFKDRFMRYAVGLWNTDKLVEHLRTNYGIENPSAVSVTQFRLRAALPTEAVALLTKKKIHNDISVNTLYQLVQIEPIVSGNPIEEASANEIINFSTTKYEGIEMVDEQKFKEIMTFLLGSPIPNQEIQTIFDNVAELKKDGLYIVKNRPELIQNIIRGRTAVDTESKIILDAMRQAGLHEDSYSEMVKRYARESMKVGAVALDSWSNWISQMPRVFWDKDDRSLENILNKESALTKHRDAIIAVQNGYKNAQTGMGAIVQQLEDAAKARTLESKPANAALSIKENAQGARQLMVIGSAVIQVLREQTTWRTEKDPERRAIALWIASNSAFTDSIQTAQKYLENPAVWMAGQPVDIQNQIKEYLGNIGDLKALGLRDILDEGRYEYGIELDDTALNILEKTKAPLEQNPDTGEWVSTGISAARIDSWLKHPENSQVALELILHNARNERGIAEGKEALIQAYTTKLPAQYKVNGVSIDISYGEAARYVTRLRDHLVAQLESSATSKRQSDKAERYMQPLDMLKTGAGILDDMLKSGDRAEQAVAIGVIGALVYGVYQGWKNETGRSIIIGSTFVLGADVMLKRATGNGFMDRFKLFYMSPEDRKSALEQFVRRSEKRPEHGSYMKTPAGYESMRQIMKHDNGIPVRDLIAWRQRVKNVGTDARGVMQAFKYSKDAPQTSAFESAATAVQGQLGAIAQRDGYEQSREQAYEYLFRAAESVYIDIADANGLGEPLADRGADLVRQKYVDFKESYMMGIEPGSRSDDRSKEIAAVKKAYYDGLRRVSLEQGGFTALNVLEFERRTPAMNKLLADTTIVESIAHAFGVGVDKARDWVEQGYGWSKMQALAAKEVAGEYAGIAYEQVIKNGKEFLEWFERTYEKAKPEVLGNFKALFDIVVDKGKKAGLILIAKGPGAIEWTFDKGVDLTNFAKDKVIDLYRELHRYQLPGSILEALESFLGRVLGVSITQELKSESYLERITDPKEFKKQIREQIARVATAPTDVQVDAWLKEEGGKMDFEAKGNAHEKMLYYELIRKNAFAMIAAARIHDISINVIPTNPDTYKVSNPLSIPWPANGDFEAAAKTTRYYEVYKYILDNYNHADVLSLMGNERTIAGVMQKLAKDNRDLWRGTISKVLLYPGILQAVTRDSAEDYLLSQMRTYVQPYIEEAGKKFGIETEEFRNYQAYIDTLIVNVLIESSLDSHGKQGELKLTADKASRFLQEVLTRRGDTPNLDALSKKSELLKKFRPADVESLPPKLRDIMNDKIKSWILIGHEPPPYVDKKEDAAVVMPGANIESTPVVSEEEAKRLEEASKDLKTMMSKEPEQANALMESMIQSYGAVVGDKEDAYKENIKELYNHRKDTLNFKDPANTREMVNYIVGSDKGAEMEAPRKFLMNKLVEMYSDKARTGADVLALAETVKPYRGSSKHPEAQDILNRTALIRLKRIMDELKKKADNDEQLSPADRKMYLDELVSLYKITNDPNTTGDTERATDHVSFALEYVLFQDELQKGGKLEEYLKFLQDRGLAVKKDEGFLSRMRDWYSQRGRMSLARTKDQIRASFSTHSIQLERSINEKNDSDKIDKK